MNSCAEEANVGGPVFHSSRLLEQLRERIRYLHYSLQTEKAYVYCARFLFRWHGRNGQMRPPRLMGQPEVEAFLTMLASDRQVSPATHRQALNAILFFYKEVLGQDLPWMHSIGRPPGRKRIPVVLTAAEVQSVLALMEGTEGVFARLLYGTGMRLAEGLNLRGKGDKDRVVMLPCSLHKTCGHSWRGRVRSGRLTARLNAAVCKCPMRSRWQRVAQPARWIACLPWLPKCVAA